jgi:hypothetical protein
VTFAHDEKALWLKAKLFLNHAMDQEEPRTFDERALWASLALELLAKAALSRVSPLLIASPTEDGNNLLIASGLVAGDARFVSVPAHTLYSRCSKAFRPFSEREAQLITRARNEYLHGGAPTFAPIPPEAWWPKYWAQAIILANAQDKNLEDLVGSSRVDIVEEHLAQNKKNIEHRVEMLLERARQRLTQYREGTLSAKLAEEWKRPTDLSAGFAYSATETCPACGNEGSLEGEETFGSTPHYERVSEEDWDAWLDLDVAASHFSCQECRLVLDSYELLEAADVATDFSATGELSQYEEQDYGND